MTDTITIDYETVYGITLPVEVYGVSANYQPERADCPGGWEISFDGVRIGDQELSCADMGNFQVNNVETALIEVLEGRG